jgi:uncharacterized protein
MKLRESILERGTELTSICSRHGARNLRLFGSVARGEDTAESDVDVLVDLQAGRTLLDVARLALELERAIGRHVDVVPATGIPTSVLAHIKHESVSVG